jgi:hypothetical protein
MHVYDGVILCFKKCPFKSLYPRLMVKNVHRRSTAFKPGTAHLHKTSRMYFYSGLVVDFKGHFILNIRIYFSVFFWHFTKSTKKN